MTWDFSTEPEFEAKLDWMRNFVREEVYPLEVLEASERDFMLAIWHLQQQVKEQKLWATHLPPELGGQGYGQVKLGLMHEIEGASVWGPIVFGNQAPDSGNSEILAHFGTEEQKKRWLHPLLDGKMRSAFSMTEPETAGSDPTLLATIAELKGDEWVINGHKWFTSNGMIADFLIAMVVTEPDADSYERASMIIDTQGASAARKEISLIKFFGAKVLHDVIDRAIQIHGSLGYSADLPLEEMYRHARSARMYDGPDEVHRVSVARQILSGYRAPAGIWPREHVPTRREAAQRKFAALLEAAVTDA